MSWFHLWLSAFVANPGYNDATKCGVSIERVPGNGSNIAHCIGVHLLTGAENAGNHNVFLSVIDAAGNRVPDAAIGWTWEGRTETQMLTPVALDKPANEPWGNIPLNARPNLQIATVWVFGGQSDLVKGLSPAPNVPEEPGSTWGHRSYFVCFQLGALVPTTSPIEPPVTPPIIVPPTFDVGVVYDRMVAGAQAMQAADNAVLEAENQRDQAKAIWVDAIQMLADLRAAHQG